MSSSFSSIDKLNSENCPEFINKNSIHSNLGEVWFFYVQSLLFSWPIPKIARVGLNPHKNGLHIPKYPFGEVEKEREKKKAIWPISKSVVIHQPAPL